MGVNCTEPLHLSKASLIYISLSLYIYMYVCVCACVRVCVCVCVKGFIVQTHLFEATKTVSLLVNPWDQCYLTFTVVKYW